MTRTHPRPAPIDQEVDHVRGPLTGRVILEYGDYECPYSRQAYRVIQRFEGLREAAHDPIRFVFRHYPLTQIHPHALGAARAAEAAHAQGRFWQMHDLLFQQQRTLEEGDLRRYAEGLGLDLGRFDRDRVAPAIASRIARDVESGNETGQVLGTPTLFIDGVVYRGAMTQDGLLLALGSGRGQPSGG